MIGPLGRLGAAATLGQHCPQMTQRGCMGGQGMRDEKGNLRAGEGHLMLGNLFELDE